MITVPPNYCWSRCCLALASVLAAYLGWLPCLAEDQSSLVDFAKEVAPIFQQRCVRCHQPGIRKGDLSLTTYADLMANEYVIPGEPDESHLLEMVSSGIDGKRPAMPKGDKPLAEGELALLRRWIAEGARWPEDVVVREKSKADAAWWSLQPVANIEPLSPTDVPPKWARIR